MRVGVIAQKLGMSAIFDAATGSRIAVTVLRLDDCQVVGHKTSERDGYVALQVGFGNVSEKKVSKPLNGFFLKNKVQPKKKVAEFRVADDAVLEVGSEINATHYVVDQFVDIAGVSVGKGFAGVMKRHGFGGLRASHGVSISHRSHGSTGQCQDPGKVFKGKKMAGHMGDRSVTVQNLKIVHIDHDKNLLFVAGGVPGSTNSYVTVQDSKKKVLAAGVPYPGIKRTSVVEPEVVASGSENIEVPVENTEAGNE